ncbi:MAG: transcription antitermination factor NusB [Thermodesulfobacteriota bacterium]
MGKRRRSRELAIKVLFHLEFSKDDHPAAAFALICNNFGAAEEIKPFSKELVEGVCSHKSEIDKLLSKASQHWRVERIARLDRTILRMALYELLYREDIPPKVTIDEAVELAKRFCSEESGAFINGILDKIYHTLIPQTGSLDVT